MRRRCPIREGENGKARLTGSPRCASRPRRPTPAKRCSTVRSSGGRKSPQKSRRAPPPTRPPRRRAFPGRSRQSLGWSSLRHVPQRIVPACRESVRCFPHILHSDSRATNLQARSDHLMRWPGANDEDPVGPATPPDDHPIPEEQCRDTKAKKVMRVLQPRARGTSRTKHILWPSIRSRGNMASAARGIRLDPLHQHRTCC